MIKLPYHNYRRFAESTLNTNNNSERGINIGVTSEMKTNMGLLRWLIKYFDKL